MAVLHNMRRGNEFSQRYCYIASDGYAYEKPRRNHICRFAHDGGTETDPVTRTTLSREELGEELWKEVWHAFLQNHS